MESQWPISVRSVAGSWSPLSTTLFAMLLLIGPVGAETAGSGETSGADETASQLTSPTHRQVRLIEPKLDGKTVKLYTIAMTPDGNLLAGVAASRNAVLMLGADGETLAQWNVEFPPTAVTAAPDGTVYAGGGGKIAQLGSDGDITVLVDSPHVGDVEELKQKAAESIRASRARMGEIYGRQIELMKERLAKLEEKDASERSKLEEAQIKAYQRQVESLQRYAAPQDAEIPEQQLKAAIQRSLGITSLAASEQDLFVCAYDPGGSGYGVWRVGRDLDSGPVDMIMQGLRGCCGQMDIQCCEGKLLVSENTKFKLAIYDRDGQPESNFGARDRTSRAGFGGCCNPMNSLPMSDGTFLTAESSIGHIKRFDRQGNLIAYIGKASIGGGCKHCAMAYNEKDDLYFMMYQDKNAICVLANNEQTPMTTAERRSQQRKIDFLSRASGTWNLVSDEAPSANSGGVLSLFSSNRSAAARRQLISSMKLDSDGGVEILEGTYRVYGKDSELELLPTTDDSKAIAFALTKDQVRFVEGTWTFTGDGEATLKLQRSTEPLRFRRDASDEKCRGADCELANCNNKNCPQHAAAAGENSIILPIESSSASGQQDE